MRCDGSVWLSAARGRSGARGIGSGLCCAPAACFTLELLLLIQDAAGGCVCLCGTATATGGFFGRFCQNRSFGPVSTASFAAAAIQAARADFREFKLDPSRRLVIPAQFRHDGADLFVAGRKEEGWGTAIALHADNVE